MAPQVETHIAGIQKLIPLKYDLAGQAFGRWTAIERDGSKWKCICLCGEIKAIDSADLRLGKSKSCGCLRKELQSEKMSTHGMAGTRVHRIWKAMWTRCTNPNTPAYKTYQNRTPPVEWMDFATFYADLGDAPSSAHSIERINNNLPYSKENCHWALPFEQSRNTKRNRLYSFNGETKCLADWADSAGINRGTLLSRLESGMVFDLAITKPVRNLSGRNL